jgi:hypothetical protein
MRRAAVSDEDHITSKAFRSWLQERGAEMLEPCEWEILRFRCESGLGIVYRRKSGSLTFTNEAAAAYKAYRKGDGWRAGTRSTRKTMTNEVRSLLARDGDRCFFCGEPMEEPTVEHLVARTANGPHHVANLCLVHATCGSWAGTRPVVAKVALREEMRSLIRASAEVGHDLA